MCVYLCLPRLGLMRGEKSKKHVNLTAIAHTHRDGPPPLSTAIIYGVQSKTKCVFATKFKPYIVGDFVIKANLHAWTTMMNIAPTLHTAGMLCGPKKTEFLQAIHCKLKPRLDFVVVWFLFLQ